MALTNHGVIRRVGELLSATRLQDLTSRGYRQEKGRELLERITSGTGHIY